MGSKVRVLIVDDHPVVRQGIEAMLSTCEDIEVVAQASDGASALQSAERLTPEVVLLDIRMPGSDGVQTTRRLKQTLKGIKVIILTTFEDDEYLFGALEAGADGYLLKTASAAELGEAVRTVGLSDNLLLSANQTRKVVQQLERVTREKVMLESGLSREELSVLELIADGRTNREIAERLFMSEITVKRRLQYIIHKLGVSDRTQAVAVAIRRGLI